MGVCKKVKKMKIATTPTDALKLLWEGKFFVRARTFSEVRDELSKKGYNFPNPQLAKGLERAKYLTRKGSKGSFSYIQKYPFQKIRK